MEFTLKEWKKLKKTADKNKIIFLSSPFSEKAVDVLSKIKVPAYKIASGEINNYLMLEKIIAYVTFGSVFQFLYKIFLI